MDGEVGAAVSAFLSYSNSATALYRSDIAAIASTALMGHGISSNYLRGELAGHNLLVGGITNNVILIEAKSYQGRRTFSWGHELTHIALTCGANWSSTGYGHSATWDSIALTLGANWSSAGYTHSVAWDSKEWDDYLIVSAMSRLQRTERRILLRVTEPRAQLQSAALKSVLTNAWNVVFIVSVVLRSVIIYVTEAYALIRTFMVHRNSRESAYYFISRLPMYRSSAGVAVAH